MSTWWRAHLVMGVEGRSAIASGVRGEKYSSNRFPSFSPLSPLFLPSFASCALMLAWWACACLIAAVCDGTIEVFGHSSYAVLSEPIYARENNKTSRPYVEFSGTGHSRRAVACGSI